MINLVPNIIKRLENIIIMSDDYAKNSPDPEDRDWHKAKLYAYRHALYIVTSEDQAAK